MSRVIELRQAMPYLRLFQEKTFVIKLGGSLVAQETVRDNLTHQIALLHQLKIRVILVHGGGDQASDLCRRLGLDVATVNGRRITDADTLEVCKMVFNGSVNTDLLAALNAQGVPATGISGVDGATIRARRRPPVTIRDSESGAKRQVDFGLVGDLVEVDSRLPRLLLEGGFVPVVSSLAAGPGDAVFNVNADTVAAHLAMAVEAEKLIVLTGAPGVLENPDLPDSLIAHMNLARLKEILEGSAKSGMHAKLEACQTALEGGVPRAHIISGLESDSLVVEVFTNEGCGTLIEN